MSAAPRPIRSLGRGLALGLALTALAIAAVPPTAPSATPATPAPRVAPWPEADALFHRDPRWLGADCAYSIDLGRGRVLWLFGDTFVATTPALQRRGSKMPRNTLAIQQGYDPAKADIHFYWRTIDGAPASFFPDSGDTWYWPGHGVRLDGELLLFFMKVQKVDGGLGFAVTGWTAVAIDNPDDPPDSWHLHWLAAPKNARHAILGAASVVRRGDWVEAFSPVEPSPRHEVYLVRWPIAALRRHDLSAPEWWEPGARRWVSEGELPGDSAPVFTDAQTEFTVHFESRSRKFIEIQTRGFGGADLAVRFAPDTTGPWSDFQHLHRPAEATRARIMIYAGKAHPQLTAPGADLVLTYATNTDWELCLDDLSLYYPRFLKVNFTPGSAGDLPVRGK
jgi:hypothetical protein